ncbi:hypothetical protein NMG60_11007098 [Bertholletia excelsa]
MEAPEPSGGGRPSPTRKQLQGARPPQLKVRKESHVIQKPPVAPPPRHPPQPPVADNRNRNHETIIIYAVSPRVIHTTVADFLPVVQRLTGLSSVSASGDLSPAARLASIERTSPKERELAARNDDLLTDLVEGVELGQIPGILSPAPTTLPPISAEIFSVAPDPDPNYTMAANMFMPSPSSLFSSPLPMFSPSPTTVDLFNLFFDS